MQSAYFIHNLTCVAVNLYKRPSNVFHFRLKVSRVAKQIAEAEEELVLHFTNNIRDVLRISAFIQKPL